ncbi:MAG: serine/threonine-protein kinase [Streptosporangiaceae bacterium]
MGGEFPGDAGGPLGGLAVGSLVAGYRLEEQVGAGGMAVVFRARDERLGRLVALKILAPALAADEAFRHRFIRESRAAAAVDDPHIIPVYEAGDAGGVLFIAMRYVPGGDMRTIMNRDGPLASARVVAIISPVASALDAAHGAGLVHRDVKPANMLVDVQAGRPDHVYLSDFGLSKGVLSASVGLTGTGQFLGTVDYISPEQIEGKPVDGRADQYALACAAFELLTGAPPFRRDEAMAVMFAQLSQPPPPITDRRPELPRAADQVFARALAKAPGDRYASCREFADALRAAFGLAPYDSGPGVIPPAVPSTLTNWPAARGAAQERIPVGDAVVGAVSPAPGVADMPTRKGAIPGPPPTAAGPKRPGRPGPGAGDDGEAQPDRRGRRRRIVLVTLTGIGALAVAVIVAVVVLVAARGHGSAGFPIAAQSSFPPVTGDVFVVYHGGTDASARIHGEINGAASGETARLYAQQFPYKSAPSPAGSVVLHPGGATAKYAFQVTPSLATRYKVELFRSRTATTPLESSATSTIYVIVTGRSGADQTCSRPVCHETFHIRVFVPASALKTEISMQWYPYFGLNLAPAQPPAQPTLLLLGAGGPHVSKAQRISPGEFDRTITFSFPIGNHAYSWNWTTCSKDTEALDGIGLPGRHGCAAKHARASATALVSSSCTRRHPCAGFTPAAGPTASPEPTTAPAPTAPAPTTTAPVPTPTTTAPAPTTTAPVPTPTTTAPTPTTSASAPTTPASAPAPAPS